MIDVILRVSLVVSTVLTVAGVVLAIWILGDVPWPVKVMWTGLAGAFFTGFVMTMREV